MREEMKFKLFCASNDNTYGKLPAQYGLIARNLYKDGADWYRNNVWHEISEDPTEFDSPFLLINSSTCDLFKCDYLDVFKNVAKKFDKWAYIEDLLPDNCIK